MRWKFIIPFFVFIFIIVAFIAFFLDGIVESIVEERASLINRAKVEIEDLEIGFLRPGVRIRGLAVANADNPWRNMVEIGDIGISVSLLPLLSKRIVIDEMVMENVQLNTKRKTSGELPRRLKKRAKVEERKESHITFPFPKLPKLEVLKEKLDPKKLVDINRLGSVRRAKQLAEDVSRIKSRWKSEIEDLDVKAKANEIMTNVQENLDALQEAQIKGPADLLRFQGDLRNLWEAIESLKGLRDGIKAKKSAFKRDLATLKKTVEEEIEALKEQDIRAILRDLGIEEFERLKLTEAFLGPFYAKALELIWNNADKIRTFMPKVEEDKPVRTRIRAQGRDIIYPSFEKGPHFLLRDARVSMEQGELSLRGTIRGITSDPTSYGKPARIAIRGKRPRFNLDGILDHTGEAPFDIISLALNGYELDGFEFAENPLSLSNITAGVLDLKANLALKGESIDLKVMTTVKNLVLDFSEMGTENQMVDFLKEVMKTAPSLRIVMAARGTRDNPQLSITSNIDRLLTGQLKRFAGKKLNRLRASLRAQIDGALGKEMKGYSDTLTEANLDILQIFGSDESLVQENIDFLSRIMATKMGKSKALRKGIEEIVPGLILK